MTGRTPTIGDAPRIAALFDRAGAVDGGGRVSAAEVVQFLTEPASPPENFRLFEADGEAVAYADLWRPDPADGRIWADVCVPPERRGGEVEAAVLAWAEARARTLGCRLLRAGVASTSSLAATLEARGYRRIRHSFTMAVELGPAPPAPMWPEGIEVRAMRPGEERAVYEADVEAFADHWEFTASPVDVWLHHMTGDGFDPSLWFLACDGGEIAGFCLCRASERLGGPTGWIGLLGVRPRWRRRGLGRALLLHAFRELRSRGLPVAGLGVDGENTTGAVRLYERAGMRVVHRRESWELALR